MWSAIEYLRARQDIDHAQIGLVGVSQGGWIAPISALRAKDVAFLVSISGAGVSPAETAIDEARNEMAASRMRPQAIEQIIELMKLQYRFARTGEGCNDYYAAREKLASVFGRAPATFSGTPDDAAWEFMRRFYFYDPAPTLARLRIPTLALFGELDDNILAEKTRQRGNVPSKPAAIGITRWSLFRRRII